jgi:dienelactone hydrolase
MMQIAVLIETKFNMTNIFRITSCFAALSLMVGCTNSNQNTEAEIVEPVVNVVGKELSYRSDTTEMKGYLAYDENDTTKRPGILVVHEWWGHDEYARTRAKMLAELGYVALAVDMYGDGQKADHPEDAMKFSGMVMGNMDASKARFEAAYAELVNNPNVDPNSISAIGYCFGGSLIMAFANGGMDLDGVAAFHSGVQLPVAPGVELKARVLVQNGAADPFITEESVTDFKAQMDSVGARYEYISYPDAMHAYTNPGATAMGEKFNLPLQYNKEADEKSWLKLQEFLASIYPD